MDIINSYTQSKGIYVIDRGGDRKKLIKSIISKGLKFIIRIRGERLFLLGNNRKRIAEEIATQFVEYINLIP